MKLEDIKTAWPLLTALVILSGFYYTTQMRLDDLEESVAKIEKTVDVVEDLESEVKTLKRKLSKRNKQK
tara:strand:- start:8 stop:214 length:207 start_codon:yes stop_codon:yes gene_type:complete